MPMKIIAKCLGVTALFATVIFCLLHSASLVYLQKDHGTMLRKREGPIISSSVERQLIINSSLPEIFNQNKKKLPTNSNLIIGS